jgi:flagellar basal body P-ring formation protein FlgA
MNPHPLSYLSRAWRRAGAAVLGAGLALAAGAQQQPQPAVSADPAGDLGTLSARWLNEAVQAAQAQGAAGSMPLRMEVSVGSLDPRLRLAPCNRVEPYLPIGARLWGRTRLGLRCLDGATRWNVFLPVTIKAWGPAFVLTGNVPAGTVLTAADAMESEVDWAADTAPVAATAESWVGLIASRYLLAGQTLRQNMIRAPELFKAGTQVRVVAQGPGFSVTSSGQAITAGAVGQSIRVRMDNGRVISGTVSQDGTIEATL